MKITKRKLYKISNIFLIFSLPFIFAGNLSGDSDDNVYQLPEQILVDIIDAPSTPVAVIYPGSDWIVLLRPIKNPPISELAERELGLAGLLVKPGTNSVSRTWQGCGLSLLRISDLEEREVTGLPENPRIESIKWSPDGSYMAFTNTSSEGVELWLLDIEMASARQLTDACLSTTAHEYPAWLPDNRTLICCMVPEERGPEPLEPAVPVGPIIQENIGRTAPAITYQDLLKNEYDEELFEYYLTTQLISVNIDGEITEIGEPDIFWYFDPSPDGRYLLVSTLHHPFSHLVTARRFPSKIEVWDIEGNPVYLVTDRPLQEEIPIARGSVETGPRSINWRNDRDAVLYWAEALDGGDAGAEAEFRDRIFLLPAPFSGDPVSLITLSLRYSNIRWANDDLALISEWWWDTRAVRTWRIKPGMPETEAELLFDYSWEDRYHDPGQPLMTRNSAGRSVMFLPDEETILLRGEGASPEGNRPFLDLFNFSTGETERLFHSEAPYYESPVTIMDEEGKLTLTRRESVDDPPNYFIRNLITGETDQITFFPHPTPQLTGFSKELIHYRRSDGIPLTATLYLPAGYEPDDEPLPMLMFAYPREFKDASAAGQVTDSPYRFDRIVWWSPMIFLSLGYAILDNPAMPIIGEGDEEPNDTYLEQLLMSAEAAVEEVVRRGAADRDRIGIGGHSYGAFTTANLLAHSDLFSAGFARTGAYNRTLTPFGFQSENRTLWEAPDVYFELSPFMHADKINEPILIIHGEEDTNPGTFPMQSERFYNALKGLGGTARLVLLPFESHSYRARESILHVLWETQEWLEKYVNKTN